MDLSRALGWLPPERYRASPRAKPAALRIWHESDYLDALAAAEARQRADADMRAKYNLGTPSNPVFPEMFRRPATAAGASMLAAELLAGGGTIYSPGGGTHHGLPGRANGFCYLNDPVLAILTFRKLGLRRVAYVDLDAHHPDGVEFAFSGDPDILIISVHEERRWPFTGGISDQGAGNVFNLPVPRDFNDTEMAAVRDSLILPACASFRPEALVLQCGADALLEDPLSRLALSNGALWSVVRALQDAAPRFLVLGGGGYNPWSVGRAWTGVWATLCRLEIPDRLPPEGEAVLRGVDWPCPPKAREPAEILFTSIADPPRDGQLREDVRARIGELTSRLHAAV